MDNENVKYSAETFEQDGFIFAEVAPAKLEALKTTASRMYPNVNGAISASAAHQVYKLFFVTSCVSWSHAEGKECNDDNKSAFFDSCYEYVISAIYAAKLHFEGVRRERGKKLVAGSRERKEKS
jgi:hypothetical protein